MFARDAISKIAEVSALGYNGANMANPNSIVLAATAEKKGLKSVLVGGNAVNLYGYHRTTFDVDLLVREKDSAKWVSFFERHGYKIFQQTSNFTRLNFADDPAGALPVDLMLADDDTFRKIHAESRYREIGKDIRLAIPSPLHLVAMKLHALKSPPRLEQGLDLQDVIHLIKSAKIDIHGREFREIAERYATEAIRGKILHELGEESGS